MTGRILVIFGIQGQCPVNLIIPSLESGSVKISPNKMMIFLENGFNEFDSFQLFVGTVSLYKTA
jgi:hypothetical protein